MVHIVRHLLRAREYFRNRVVRRSIVKKLGNVGDLVDYGLVLKDTSCIDPSTLPIYVMWWQGEENMPEVVRVCYHNLLQKAGKHPVHLITRDNITRYIDENDGHWDKIIFEKVKDGDLYLTQFSDIVRTYLTAYRNPGGVWVDSTIYITANSVDEFISLPFSTGRYEEKDRHYWSVCENRWTGFYIAALEGNPLSQFLYNGLVRLLHVDGTIKEYFTIDNLFVYAYWHVKGVKELVDSSPTLNRQMFAFGAIPGNRIFRREEFESVCAQVPFQKLTYKVKGEKYVDGKQTFYGYLMQQNDQ